MFPCTKCGCCCKRMHLVTEALKTMDGLDFPYPYDETGRCSQLAEDNTCKVYDHRPLICNIDKLTAFFRLDKEFVYETTIAECNRLMDEADIPAAFRIKI